MGCGNSTAKTNGANALVKGQNPEPAPPSLLNGPTLKEASKDPSVEEHKTEEVPIKQVSSGEEQSKEGGLKDGASQGLQGQDAAKEEDALAKDCPQAAEHVSQPQATEAVKDEAANGVIAKSDAPDSAVQPQTKELLTDESPKEEATKQEAPKGAEQPHGKEPLKEDESTTKENIPDIEEKAPAAPRVGCWCA